MGKIQILQCLSTFELKMLLNFFQAARTPQKIAAENLKKKEARVKINHYNFT